MPPTDDRDHRTDVARADADVDEVDILVADFEPELDPSPRTLPYVGALDGLRGVAVAGVLLFHGGVATTGGFLGVSTFFTLSGFLITSLLLAQSPPGTGEVALVRFWGRRFRRLLPASLLAIALAVLLTWWLGGASQLQSLRGDALGSLAYVANWRFLASAQSYANVFGAPSYLLHVWSLAIEEQFYLLFPLLAWVVLKLSGGSRRVFGTVLAVLFVASASLPHLLDLGDDRVYYGTDVRAAEMLAGALLAVGLVLARRPLDAVDRGWGRGTRLAATIAGTVAFVAMLASWVVTSQSSRWVYAGGLPLYAGLTVVVIVAALVPRHPVQVVLALDPLRWLGRISYGVYLYHWPLFLGLAALAPDWSTGLRFAVGTVVTLAVATASFVLIEQPIRERRPVAGRLRRADGAPGSGSRSGAGARSGTPRVVLAGVGGAAAVAVLALAATTAVPDGGARSALDAKAGSLVTDVGQSTPTTAGSGYFAAATPLGPPPPQPDPNPPTLPAGSSIAAVYPTMTGTATATGPLTPATTRLPSRTLRVVVVGDSTAVFLDPGLATWGKANKALSVNNWARIGCGIGRGGSRTNHATAEPVPPECGDWATELPRVLKELHADVVVVASAFWDATDRQLPGDETWRAPGDATYDDFLRREMGAMADMIDASGAVTAWLDNAPVALGRGEVPARTDYPVNEPARTERVNALLGEVAATRPTMRVIPFASFMTSWPEGPFQLRADGIHVDETTGAATAVWLGPEVLDAYFSVRQPGR